MRRFLPFAIILGVFLIATGAAIELYRNHDQSFGAIAPVGKLAFGRPGAEPPHIRGPFKAPVALEEFGDFECVPCSLLMPVLKKAKDDYGDKLSVTFREYPLDQHIHAIDGARAAEAAGLQGHFWEMHDSLYENRLVWLNADNTRATLVSLAQKIGLDIDRFKTDLDAVEVTKRLAADHDRVDSLGLDRTPSVLINGDRLTTRPITPEVLHAAIDAALGKSK
jgi:protein-disulfide isomerase